MMIPMQVGLVLKPGPQEPWTPYRMAQAMLDLYCDSFPVVPSHLTLDLDESFDRVHGEQELRKFNAYYDDWGFLPIHIYDAGTGRPVAMILPAPAPEAALPTV